MAFMRSADCLVCSHCTGVADPNACRSTQLCSPGQSCFQRSRTTQSGTVTYDMGCMDTQICAVNLGLPIVGRSITKREKSDCQQCCSVDNCNENLCTLGSLTQSFLLFVDSRNSAVFRMDLATQSYVLIESLNPVVTNPVAIDYDYVHQNVYWTDVLSKLIVRGHVGGAGTTIIESLSSSSTADGLAIDPESRLLFYTDTGTDVIAVLNIDTRKETVIIDSGLDQPRAITLDVKQRKMYWTDWGSHPKIEVSNYDGTNRRILVDSGLQLPNAVALDPTDAVIYWADAGTAQIEKMNLDGSNRLTLSNGGSTSHYFGLAVDDHALYYTDWNRNSVMTLPKSGGTAVPFGKPAFGRLNDIHAYTGPQSNTGNNACVDGNGGCDHICLPLAGNSRTCVCQQGYTLQTNGKSCSGSASVRLTGGNSTSKGRVEVSLNGGSWGTICDDRFGPEEANIICSMLGFQRTGAIAKDKSYFGQAQSSLPIVLDDLDCIGTEGSILECSHSPLGSTDCSHNEDASVICASEGQVYLSGTDNNYQGRVEVFLNGRWGTICDDSFGQNEAKVVCGMLGFPRNGSLSRGASAFGPGVETEPIHLDNVQCAGTEASILDCQHNRVDVSDCGHSEDVGVLCQADASVKVRLTGSSSNLEGRVEISVDNGATWGTVCDDNFGTAEAGVVCAMMGFSRTGAAARGSAYYGAGSSSQNILLDDVTCTGSEYSIMQCQHSVVGTSNCAHSEDVGVTCQR
ncbi:scavenger receptor cysteine-rich type 1 protein M130-like isoform X2 [Dreissena polymorpha]|uniref:scavenger receptor cysteine-rich type 1 protein M130-like isoform X2 n=1 Tax=Dreissena polymorpha TaxID=45954 RepID=UPI002264EDB9|nr:scavenger receptor cysteine-rich type 1 protein M130-like isoform X2 [Dreissena polymorpha]